MAKATGKSIKAGGSTPHKHLHSRISFLHQAATYLSTASSAKTGCQNDTVPQKQGQQTAPVQKLKNVPQSRYLINHLKAVSRKSQIRLTPKLKHSLCKRCDALLIPGQTSTEEAVNTSRGRKKPWADVFQVTCNSCGAVKRFPTVQQSQPSKPARRNASEEN